jgi:hypothetical protein
MKKYKFRMKFFTFKLITKKLVKKKKNFMIVFIIQRVFFNEFRNLKTLHQHY